MNRLGQARTNLIDALEPVLDGRTFQYPPAANQTVAPQVWIDQPSGFRTTIGQGNTQVMVATFPVWIVYDGADRAQVAGLDDLVSRVIDASTSCPGSVVTGWRTEPQDPGSNRRASIVDVDVTITATTFCLPDPVLVTA